MRILGIVGSRRKLGNTEIMVKEALKGAREEGAEIAILRITDLYVKECNGCEACVIKGEECRLNDDMAFFEEQLNMSDGLIIGGADYAGAPLGIFKTIGDRLHGLRSWIERAESKKASTKKAITIGAAGWRHLQYWIIPLLNSFAGLCGCEVLASFVGISVGPGEVLLPEREAIPRQVNRLGRDLVLALKGEEERLSPAVHRLTIFDPEARGEKLFTEHDCCPYCFSTAFQLVSAMELRCAFCHYTTVYLRPRGSRIELHFEVMNEEQRLEEAKRHLEEEIRPSGPRFLSRRAEIEPKRRLYQDIGIDWEKPPLGSSIFKREGLGP
jgi:multimeric flavodoxin WrbA